MSASPYPLPAPDDLASLYAMDRRDEMSRRTLVMGVLNVTPDSFSDGGRFFSLESALKHARRMIEEGADLLDIGGESTRPGSEPIGEAEEMGRVLPVVEALAQETAIPLSVDTTRSRVAREAVERGARMLNDISGLRFDPEMATVAAESDAFLVLMHSRDTPKTMHRDTHYDDLMREVTAFLRGQARLAEEKGVQRERILLDPGLGFSKTAGQNLVLLRRQKELLDLGYPLLIGPSRKSFIGKILRGLPPEERVEGTGAAVTLAIAGGARVVRVHDVKPMVRVARVADAICGRLPMDGWV